jgi:hypothetical protein
MKNLQLFSRRGFVAAAFIAIAAFQSGCVTVVDNSAPGSTAYIRGELQATVEQRFEVVESAAKHAITELQFSNIEEKKDALVAIITARTAEDARINVKVERSTDKVTTIRIRAGMLGNEKLAHIILEKIKEGF